MCLSFGLFEELHTHRGEQSQSHLTAGCTSCVIAAAAAPARTWETLTQTSTRKKQQTTRACVGTLH